MGQSTCFIMFGTTSSIVFKKAIMSSVFFSSSASLTFVKYPACSGSNGASCLMNRQKSRSGSGLASRAS